VLRVESGICLLRHLLAHKDLLVFVIEHASFHCGILSGSQIDLLFNLPALSLQISILTRRRVNLNLCSHFRVRQARLFEKLGGASRHIVFESFCEVTVNLISHELVVQLRVVSVAVASQGLVARQLLVILGVGTAVALLASIWGDTTLLDWWKLYNTIGRIIRSCLSKQVKTEARVGKRIVGLSIVCVGK
jgi:hypothetical protein